MKPMKCAAPWGNVSAACNACIKIRCVFGGWGVVGVKFINYNILNFIQSKFT